MSNNMVGLLIYVLRVFVLREFKFGWVEREEGRIQGVWHNCNGSIIDQMYGNFQTIEHVSFEFGCMR